MNNLAISVKGISKRYEIYAKPVDRLKQSLFRGKKQFYKEVWALRDVSFDLPKGKVFGIIGMNGAGKSTLLQILAKILHPTSGEITVRGNIMSLLELGSGFNPEFTGRENIYYYGMLMGQTKKQIETNIKKIIDFADIGDFIDQPIKTYSSGMVMRLAFSVITNSSPDILLVDEVMAVGDINFQMKCMRWMQDFSARGGTICMVSHDLNLIANRSDYVILLKNGRIDQAGPPLEVIQKFRYDVFECKPQVENINVQNRSTIKRKGAIDLAVSRKGNGKALITKILVNGRELMEEVFLKQQEPIEVEIEAVFSEPFEDYSFGVLIVTSKGADIFAVSSRLTGVTHPAIMPNKPISCVIKVEQNLQPGEYYLQVAVANVHSKEVVELLDVTDAHVRLIVVGTSNNVGIVDFPHTVNFCIDSPSRKEMLG